MKNNKSLGQHWLKNRAILDEIASQAVGESDKGNFFWGHPQDGEDAAPNPATAGVRRVPKRGWLVANSNLCLEIGPGLGTLTSSLLKHFNKVIAVEYDERLAKNLPKSFPGKNLEVVHADILDFDFQKLPTTYTTVGNIPYYITSPIIEKLLTAKNPPAKIVLLIQKEVVERIASPVNTLLSLFVKNRADVTIGPVVKKAEFTPPPKVDSQVIILEPHAPVVSDQVFDLIKVGFKSPRKKLIHNLSSKKPKKDLAKIFTKLNIDSNSRPGNLSLADWQNLFDIIAK